jgi:hypothetical protein
MEDVAVEEEAGLLGETRVTTLIATWGAAEIHGYNTTKSTFGWPKRRVVGQRTIQSERRNKSV